MVCTCVGVQYQGIRAKLGCREIGNPARITVHVYTVKSIALLQSGGWRHERCPIRALPLDATGSRGTTVHKPISTTAAPGTEIPKGSPGHSATEGNHGNLWHPPPPGSHLHRLTGCLRCAGRAVDTLLLIGGPACRTKSHGKRAQFAASRCSLHEQANVLLNTQHTPIVFIYVCVYIYCPALPTYWRKSASREREDRVLPV